VKFIIPISQPIDRPSTDHHGTHWTVGVMDFHSRKIDYINSAEGCDEFPRFQQVSYKCCWVQSSSQSRYLSF